MTTTSPTPLELIRERLTIDKFMNLSSFKHQGKELVGPHPVHGSETRTNLHINLSKGVWHCMRCNAGGDALDLLAVVKGMAPCDDRRKARSRFAELLEIAAPLVGVELTPIPPEERERIRLRREKEEELQRVRDRADSFFRASLTPETREVIKRQWPGVSDETIDEFGFGYAPPGGRELSNVLLKEFGPVLPIESGLVLGGSNGAYDLFQGRIIIPYLEGGKPRYFIGRATEHTPEREKDSKYKKLPSSEWVREPIFGVDSVNGSGPVIITEGVVDCIQVIAHGFPSVSPVTPRFASNVYDKVGRLLQGHEVVIVNDNEDSGAGLEGALKVSKELDSRGIKTKIGLLPRLDGVKKIDVADYFATHTAEDFQRDILDRAMDGIEARAVHGDSMGDLFAAALVEEAVDPRAVHCFEVTAKNKDGEDEKRTIKMSVWEVMDDISDIHEAVATARRRYRAVGSRGLSMVEARLVPRAISGAIRRYLQRGGGRYLHTAEGATFYFSPTESTVYPLGSKEWEAILADRFGVNFEESEGKILCRSLINYALVRGELVKVQKLSYYDPHTQTLYYFNGDKIYYELTGGEVVSRPNGLGGVFFLREESLTPFVYMPPDKRPSISDIPGEIPCWKNRGDPPLVRALFNRTNFTESTALSVEEQRFSLIVYTYGLQFRSLIDTKPIALYTGVKGSGKSTTLRITLRFIFGPMGDISPLPDEQGFIAAVCSKPFYFVDNVEWCPRWLEDRLATVASGGSVQKRALYTTNELVEFRPECFLAMTAREPHFRRDDVADRLLIYHVQRFDDFIPESVFFAPVDNNRDALLSEYLDGLNKIVKSLRVDGFPSDAIKHRIADWAAFAVVVNRAFGLGVDVDTFLDHLQSEKASFVMEEDSFFHVLKVWCELSDTTPANEITAADLFRELKELSVKDGISFDYTSAQAIAKRMAHIKEEMEEVFGLTITARKNKASLYRFEKKFEKKIPTPKGSQEKIPADLSPCANELLEVVSMLSVEGGGDTTWKDIMQEARRRYPSRSNTDIDMGLEELISCKLVEQFGDGKYYRLPGEVAP